MLGVFRQAARGERAKLAAAPLITRSLASRSSVGQTFRSIDGRAAGLARLSGAQTASVFCLLHYTKFNITTSPAEFCRVRRLFFAFIKDNRLRLV